MQKVLITGGSGLLGTRLTELLVSKGYAVAHLSRKSSSGNIQTHKWDIQGKVVEQGAFDDVDHIVHLAGANIAEKPWTKEQKKIFLSSRKDSADLLFAEWKKSGRQIKSFISASGIGYYGMQTNDHVYHETDAPDSSYISQLCVEWEKPVQTFAAQNVRSMAIRIGIVLAPNGGALGKLAPIVKTGLASPLGSGKQWMPWIHVDDLCRLFIRAMENETYQGVYNGVAPNPVTNKQFLKTLGKTLNRPVFLPNVPAFALKLIMGEMAGILLEGSKVSAKKTMESGFTFEYTELEKALEAIYAK